MDPRERKVENPLARIPMMVRALLVQFEGLSKDRRIRFR